jgi:hypothetical protein
VARARTKRAVEYRVTSMVQQESTTLPVRQVLFLQALFDNCGSSTMARFE